MASHTSAVMIVGGLRIAGTVFGGVYPKAIVPPTSVRDVNFGGTGRVAGTVTEKATPVATPVPVSRRVRLHRKKDGILVREAWSDVNGAYSFNYVDRTVKYYVVSFDQNLAFNAVIDDEITPEAIP